jgi:hypothetical protein
MESIFQIMINLLYFLLGLIILLLLLILFSKYYYKDIVPEPFVINKLYLVEYETFLDKNKVTMQYNCNICFNDHTEGYYFKECEPVKHYFCHTCILDYGKSLINNNSYKLNCPICRKNVWNLES